MKLQQYLKIIFSTLIFSTACYANISFAEVVIIVHPSNPASSISKNEVRRIFLGKSSEFRNGSKVTAVDQESGSDSRVEFYKKLMNKTETQLKLYWSKVIFTGKGMPPKQAGSESNVKSLVSKNPSYIGYIDSSSVDASVKVLAVKGNGGI